MKKIIGYIHEIKSWIKNHEQHEIFNDQFQLGILLGGQSNAMGNTSGAPPSKYRKPLEGVCIENNEKWETLKYGENQQSYKSHTFGPELSLGYHLRKYYNRDIYIAKHSVSSAPIYNDPKRINYNLKSNQAYPELRNAGLALQEKIESLGKIPVIIFVWIQGEGDVADEKGTMNYYSNFSKIHSQLQEDGIQISYTILNKLKIGNRWEGQILQNYKKVQKQQEDWVKSHDNTYLIDMKEFSFGRDQLHFSSKSQIKIGKKLQKIITEEIVPRIPFNVLAMQAAEFE